MAATKQKMAEMEAQRLGLNERCSVGDKLGVFESLAAKPLPPLFVEVEESLGASPTSPTHPPKHVEKPLAR